MKQIPPSPLSRHRQLALIILFFLASLPHIHHLAGLISGFVLVMVVYRLFAISWPRLLPGKLLLILLTLTALANVILQYPLLIGRTAGVALLCSMGALKLLEMKSQRDVYVLSFIGYFTLGSHFLFQDQAWLVLYVILVVTGFTAVLAANSRANPINGLLPSIKTALVLLIQAAPIMLVLFILFPRFTSPLWNLGPESDQAVTGISGSITPGNLSQLSRSSAVAFRAEFDDEIPPPEQRYWRGPVFTNTDGVSWLPVESENNLRVAPASGARTLDYSVTMEPSPGRWLYALEFPSHIPGNARLQADFQLIRSTPISRRIRYRASSVVDYRINTSDPDQLQLALALPSTITPRMRDLVKDWKGRAQSSAELVLTALDYFRQQPFYYTLYPPELGENAADAFLFETRQGFCEHYATSFTLLMRIAGIPARVVAGYQGGEVNPMGNYLIVRQSDAHAWSEIWLEGEGWMRIDPTAAVAPERVENPLDLNQISQLVGSPVLYQHSDNSFIGRTIKKLGLSLDALHTAWYRWILGYSRERQSHLLSMLGLGFLQGTKLALGMVVCGGMVVLVMVLLAARESSRPKNPVVASYHRFCKRLKLVGLDRQPHEGPNNFAQRVINQRPDLSSKVTAITQLYVGIRYGQLDSRERRRHLKRLVKAFHPAKKGT